MTKILPALVVLSALAACGAPQYETPVGAVSFCTAERCYYHTAQGAEEAGDYVPAPRRQIDLVGPLLNAAAVSQAFQPTYSPVVNCTGMSMGIGMASWSCH